MLDHKLGLSKERLKVKKSFDLLKEFLKGIQVDRIEGNVQPGSVDLFVGYLNDLKSLLKFKVFAKNLVDLVNQVFNRLFVESTLFKVCDQHLHLLYKLSKSFLVKDT